MATHFVRHKVADYTSWRKLYDEFDPVRKSMGVKSDGVYQLEGNPNDVTVYHEFDSVAAAKALIEDPRLREAMMKAGVQGEPDVWIGNKI